MNWLVAQVRTCRASVNRGAHAVTASARRAARIGACPAAICRRGGIALTVIGSLPFSRSAARRPTDPRSSFALYLPGGLWGGARQRLGLDLVATGAASGRIAARQPVVRQATGSSAASNMVSWLSALSSIGSSTSWPQGSQGPDQGPAAGSRQAAD